VQTVALPVMAMANEDLALDKAPINTHDFESLQRGAKLFTNYCLNCHSAGYMRYNRLQDLGLTEQQIKESDVRWDGFRRRVSFPIKDADKQVRGMTGRAIDKEVEPRYLFYPFQDKINVDMLYGEEWVAPYKPVVLVESVFDFWKTRQVYDNVIAPLTSNFSAARLKRLKTFDFLRFIVFFDGDKAGNLGVEKFKKQMSAYPVEVANCPTNMDPGGMTTEQIGSILNPLLNNSLLL